MREIVLAIATGLILATGPFAAPGAREVAKFDEFGDIECNEEKARLDNFAVQLQNQPDAKGYIIFYGGRRDRYPYPESARSRLPRRGQAQARAARLKPYIVNAWPGFDAERILVIDGGYRETWQAELWIVPEGAPPPVPTPTVSTEEIRFRQGIAKADDYRCEV